MTARKPGARKGGASHNEKKSFLLSCGCSRLFLVYPEIGDQVWCTKHDKAVTVDASAAVA